MRTWVEISRDQLARNYRAFQSAVGPGVTVAGVVKANAYGHGAVEVARVLAAEGAGWLCVSNVEEGVALRQAGLAQRVLVMGGVLPFEREALIPFQLTPVVHSLEELRELDDLPLQVHFKIDSGMGRLGSRSAAREIAAAIGALKNIRVEGLMSHFASPNDFDSPQNEQQLAHFEAVRRTLGDFEQLHFASSNAVAFGQLAAPFTMVRPGLGLYGYTSPPVGSPPSPVLDVRPVLTWNARILIVKDVAPGSTIGYNALFRARDSMRIAVIAAGYADGVPHRLSNRGHVIAGGRLAPVLGAVSMDLTTIDVTASPELKVGDPVTLIGRQGDVSLDAQQLAEIAGTISYQVLCGIGNRVKRVYY